MNIVCNLTVTNVAMLRIFEVISDKIYVDKYVLKTLQKQKRNNNNNSNNISIQFSFMKALA